MEIEEVIHTYGDYLYRVAFIYTKKQMVAEEVVQDVFFNFYQKSDQFQGSASLKTYLVKMTRNRSIDYLRSWEYKKQVVLEMIQGKTNDIERTYIEKEWRGEITEMVLTLPFKDREVLLLYYYEEMTVSEIAQLLNCSVSTIKSRLQRAREKLKPKLKGEVFTDE